MKFQETLWGFYLNSANYVAELQTPSWTPKCDWFGLIIYLEMLLCCCKKMQNFSCRRMKSFQNPQTKKRAETCLLALETSAVCKNCNLQKRRSGAGVQQRELIQVKGSWPSTWPDSNTHCRLEIAVQRISVWIGLPSKSAIRPSLHHDLASAHMADSLERSKCAWCQNLLASSVLQAKQHSQEDHWWAIYLQQW